MGGTLPLTLDCVCPDANIAVCTLQALTLVVDITRTLAGGGTVEATHTLTLYAAKVDPLAIVMHLDITAGEHTYDLPLADWASHWDTMSIELTTDASLLQAPVPAYSAYDKFWAAYYITQDFLCVNPATMESNTRSQRSYTLNPDAQTKCEPTTGDLRTVCYAGQGVGSIMYKSSPFASCSGCNIGDAGFDPVVDTNTRIDISSGDWCLCGAGGSGSYRYDLIQGQLPGGMTLDAFTGCITGTPDGKTAGTKELSFQVTDLVNRASALVTCGILGVSCGMGPQIIGNQAY